MTSTTVLKAKSTSVNFLALPASSSSFESSRIVVLPAPYEHTVSYGGGARLGPNGIIKASHYVEFYDEEFDRELCHLVGIATLDPVPFGKRVDQRAVALVHDATDQLIGMNKFVVVLGGEHTISLGPIGAYLKRYNDL